jgi:hypothetical protein
MTVKPDVAYPTITKKGKKGLKVFNIIIILSLLPRDYLLGFAE